MGSDREGRANEQGHAGRKELSNTDSSCGPAYTCSGFALAHPLRCTEAAPDGPPGIAVLSDRAGVRFLIQIAECPARSGVAPLLRDGAVQICPGGG